MIMRRIANSIREKAQSICEPKAMGVKMRRHIKMISMALSIISFSLIVLGY
jgi:hypothetical protein